jgi:hypothetical protein
MTLFIIIAYGVALGIALAPYALRIAAVILLAACYIIGHLIPIGLFLGFIILLYHNANP